MKKRLSKLQIIVLSILKAMDSSDWESWYSKHQPNNKTPYWHRVRKGYFDSDGCGLKCHFENGVKGNVEVILLKQKGYIDFTDTIGRTTYFSTPHNENRTNNIGFPTQKGASSFSVSFSRSLKTLVGRELIQAKNWKKQIAEIKLNVNNKSLDINYKR